MLELVGKLAEGGPFDRVRIGSTGSETHSSGEIQYVGLGCKALCTGGLSNTVV